MNSPIDFSCAINYDAEQFDPPNGAPIGYRSAIVGLLEALVAHAQLTQIFCLGASPEDYPRFCGHVERVRPSGTTMPVTIDATADFTKLTGCGVLMYPGPGIAANAWTRGTIGQRAFSICGLTHSLSLGSVVSEIAEAAIAPTESWDAMICISRAARDVVSGVVESWFEYLRERGIEPRPTPLRTVVIPLGVDTDRFARTNGADERGVRLRQRLGIQPGDALGLHLGRLNPLTKSHPTPMFRAFELAQRKDPEAMIHLLMVGCFSNARDEREFRLAGARYCPSVQIHWLDGRSPEADDAWFAADFFVSITDNIQESFGLAPVEAMAASLPCIVSDWNGHKDTVAEGEVGFRIPTTLAPSGSGRAIADIYAEHPLGHARYTGFVSQKTVVDIDACAEAIHTLTDSPTLRLRLGQAARRRVETRFSWRSVIGRYVELWSELAEAREHADSRFEDAGPVLHPNMPNHQKLLEAFATP